MPTEYIILATTKEVEDLVKAGFCVEHINVHIQDELQENDPESVLYEIRISVDECDWKRVLEILVPSIKE